MLTIRRPGNFCDAFTNEYDGERLLIKSIPDANSSVTRARCKFLSIRGPGKGCNCFLMPGQHLLTKTTCHMPSFDCGIKRTRRKTLAIRGPGKSCNCFLVTAQLLDKLSTLTLPEKNRPISRSQGKHCAIRRPDRVSTGTFLTSMSIYLFHPECHSRPLFSRVFIVLPSREYFRDLVGKYARSLILFPERSGILFTVFNEIRKGVSLQIPSDSDRANELISIRSHHISISSDIPGTRTQGRKSVTSLIIA